MQGITGDSLFKEGGGGGGGGGGGVMRGIKGWCLINIDYYMKHSRHD